MRIEDGAPNGVRDVVGRRWEERGEQLFGVRAGRVVTPVRNDEARGLLGREGAVESALVDSMGRVQRWAERVRNTILLKIPKLS